MGRKIKEKKKVIIEKVTDGFILIRIYQGNLPLDAYIVEEIEDRRFHGRGESAQKKS